MKIEPCAFLWSGREMVPLDRFRALANRQFRAGQEYALVPHQGRSEKAHGLYFKCVEVAWRTLPEKWQKRRDTNTERFLTSEHLRKWILVQEGYADEHTTVCDSEEKAREVAALCRSLDGYAVIRVSGNIVTVWTAQSQDKHHMGHEAFQKSMDSVLSSLADMLGITVQKLTDEAKKRMVRRTGQFSDNAKENA